MLCRSTPLQVKVRNSKHTWVKVWKYWHQNVLKVKVQYFPQRCSGVEVKVLEIGNTQVKYKYLKIVLKYSTWVNVLKLLYTTATQDQGPAGLDSFSVSGKKPGLDT